MLYELLEFDKIYLFSKNLHQNKYQALLQDFTERINPEVGYEVIEAPGDEIIPLEELPVNNQKIVVFDDLVCESNQNSIINYFVNGRHRNCCVIYFTQTFYKVPKNIRGNYIHFCIFKFLPRENKVTKVILDLRVAPAVPLILICKIRTRFCGWQPTIILSRVS